MNKVKVISGYKGTIDSKINEWSAATGASVQSVAMTEGQSIWGNTGWVTATITYIENPDKPATPQLSAKENAAVVIVISLAFVILFGNYPLTARRRLI